MSQYSLGRIESPNMDHIENSPIRELGLNAPNDAEKTLILPSWEKKANQGSYNACEGFGNTMMLSILHENICRERGELNPYIRYSPWWLWNQAKLIDNFGNTTENRGTSSAAVAQVLLSQGAVSWPNENDMNSFGPVLHKAGIAAIRWGISVQDVINAIYNGIPVSIGMNWYNNFNTPQLLNNEWWITKDLNNLGTLEGGHEVCLYAVSCKREAIKLKNSWLGWPEVWVSFDLIEKMIEENAEVSMVTDY